MWTIRPLVAVIALATCAAGLSGLAEVNRFAEITATAAAIEAGDRLSPAIAQGWTKRPLLDEALERCGPVARSAITIRLGVADALAGAPSSAPLSSGLQAVETGLRCSPLDGNLWLRRSMLLARQGAASRDVLASLRLSQKSAPADGWIIYPRIRFEKPMVDAGSAGFGAVLQHDLKAVLENEADSDIMTFYVTSSPRVRRLVRAASLELRPKRQGSVSGLLDSVDFVIAK